MLFIVVGGVSPTEGDLAIRKRDQSVIGDGDAMGVAAQITEYMFWAAERGASSKPPNPGGTAVAASAEGFGLSQELQVSMKAELAVLKACLRAATNLPRKTRPSTLTGRKNA